MLGTYGRANLGVSELRLRTANGHTLQIPFNLGDLLENQYRFFNLEQTSGGVATRVIYGAGNGVKRSTEGCPSP